MAIAIPKEKFSQKEEEMRQNNLFSEKHIL